MESKTVSIIPTDIEKEIISNLRFPASDVLKTKEDKVMRKLDLEQATRLGNLERYKVKIVFADDLEKKMVETTIWGVTANSIILKSGMVIPIHRVLDIRFF